MWEERFLFLVVMQSLVSAHCSVTVFRMDADMRIQTKVIRDTDKLVLTNFKPVTLFLHFDVTGSTFFSDAVGGIKGK